MSEKLKKIIDNRWEIAKQTIDPEITREAISSLVCGLATLSEQLIEESKLEIQEETK